LEEFINIHPVQAVKPVIFYTLHIMARKQARSLDLGETRSVYG